MNNQLKLLLYILFVVSAFFFIQDSFGLFDISFISDKEQKEDVQTEEESIVKTDTKNYVQIYVVGAESIKVDVEVADTEPKRVMGLSNRRYLGDYNGMLFIFDELVRSPFWMKDTYINLDIIYIDEKGFIVDIKEDNEPCTENYCPYIFSNEMFKYVLEVNGGFCKINGVEIGQSITMHLAITE
jgi:uncharacterized membrane protein (UPF0127 family)